MDKVHSFGWTDIGETRRPAERGGAVGGAFDGRSGSFAGALLLHTLRWGEAHRLNPVTLNFC